MQKNNSHFDHTQKGSQGSRGLRSLFSIMPYKVFYNASLLALGFYLIITLAMQHATCYEIEELYFSEEINGKQESQRHL